jgi:hypothetical protein
VAAEALSWLSPQPNSSTTQARTATRQSWGRAGMADLVARALPAVKESGGCGLLDREQGLSCDCSDLNLSDTPLCEQVPGQTPPGQIQYFSKAYPGLRHLEVLRGASARGGNATLGSICARNTSDDARPDFGYRPAMQALLERVAPILTPR